MRLEKLLIRLQGRLDLDIRDEPKIDKLSDEGNPDAIVFPKAKIEDCPYDFSFSGVKSAVLNYLNGAKMKGEESKHVQTLLLLSRKQWWMYW